MSDKLKELKDKLDAAELSADKAWDDYIYSDNAVAAAQDAFFTELANQETKGDEYRAELAKQKTKEDKK